MGGGGEEVAALFRGQHVTNVLVVFICVAERRDAGPLIFMDSVYRSLLHSI